MPDPNSWSGFTATLKEKRARPFTGFTPVETERPQCPETVLIDGALRYEFDGSNLFLLDEPGRPEDPEPSRRFDESSVPWIATVRTDPVHTPLGWSKYVGRPLFWLGENLVFPGEITSWVLWRHRNTRTVWRMAEARDNKRITPATIWSGDETSAAPLAYIMPFWPGSYPLWSELDQYTRGARPR